MNCSLKPKILHPIKLSVSIQSKHKFQEKFYVNILITQEFSFSRKKCIRGGVHLKMKKDGTKQSD